MKCNIEKSIDKAMQKSSAFRAWRILFFYMCLIAFAMFLRFFFFSVWNFEGKRVLICELALCKENSQKGNLLLAKANNKNSILLWLVGKSGEQIKVPTPFDTLKINIPNIGDTLYFDTLNPMLWDASASLHNSTSTEKPRIEISLWSKEKEIPFSYVGRASISGRPVSEREVPMLPWQELRLLEIQLQKIFPAIDSIHFKRKLFKNTTEIKNFIVDEKLFYLSCKKSEQQKLCYDSREKGFFRVSEIKGISIFPLWF
jgi:hypothetical protein